MKKALRKERRHAMRDEGAMTTPLTPKAAAEYFTADDFEYSAKVIAMKNANLYGLLNYRQMAEVANARIAPLLEANKIMREALERSECGISSVEINNKTIEAKHHPNCAKCEALAKCDAILGVVEKK